MNFKILLFILFLSYSSSSRFVYSQFSSSSSSGDINFYPFENDAKCEIYIGDSKLSNCSKYLPYNKIYTSSTINQNDSISLADQYFSFIRSSNLENCSQSYVYQTICFSLFPECQTYINEKKDNIVVIPVRTCLNECQQSIEWCNSTTSLLNCSSTIINDGTDLPIYPKNLTYYNFEQFQGGLLGIECVNPFINNIIPPSSSSSSSINEEPTIMPKETSSEQHNYDNKHRSLLYKIGISAAVFVPMVIAISLIWYNIKVRSNYFKSGENLLNNNNNKEKLHARRKKSIINDENTTLI